ALDTDAGETATLVVDATADSVINASESTHVSFTVGGIDDAGTGTVTFTDGTNHVDGTDVGTAANIPNLSSRTAGPISPSPPSSDASSHPPSAALPTFALDTDAGETATLVVDATADSVINASESTHVSFTVGGIDDAGTGTVTFTDGTN